MVEKSHASGLWPQIAEPFRNFSARVADWIAPLSDASTNGESYRISVELPGVEEKDISLAAHDGILSLSGEKRTEREEKGETWFFSERQYGSFSRSFRLPPDADEAGIKADLKDGVLTIEVPKTKGGTEARKVRINVS